MGKGSQDKYIWGKYVFGLLMCMMLFSLGACMDAGSSPETDAETDLASDLETDMEAAGGGEKADGQIAPQKAEKPELVQIRSICRLATLECYYHNVAKSVKEAGTGVAHWGEADRKFWTEYTGVAQIGVDMSRGRMDVDGTTVTIYMPEAQILSIKPNSESISHPIVDPDSWNQNRIEAEDVTGAIDEAERAIREKIENDSSLLVSAQDRAQKLVENYIMQLGEASGVEFTVNWVILYND